MEWYPGSLQGFLQNATIITCYLSKLDLPGASYMHLCRMIEIDKDAEPPETYPSITCSMCRKHCHPHNGLCTAEVASEDKGRVQNKLKECVGEPSNQDINTLRTKK